MVELVAGSLGIGFAWWVRDKNNVPYPRWPCRSVECTSLDYVPDRVRLSELLTDGEARRSDWPNIKASYWRGSLNLASFTV